MLVSLCFVLHFSLATQLFYQCNLMFICDALSNLLQFVQFKKREEHPCSNANSCNFTKINTPPWVFFTFFKLCRWHQIAQRILFTLFFAHWFRNRSSKALQKVFNSLMTDPIIQKQVHGFALQINGPGFLMIGTSVMKDLNA